MRVHLRRNLTALPAHVERVIGPSPARAEPHDAAAWLPVPDPHALPSIEMLLENARPFGDAAAEAIDLVALEAMVSPSPARAEPHDAASWLPLPDDVHVLPSVHDLRDPHPEVQAAVVAEAEALVTDALAAAEASSVPSPARAEPHDPTSWLPLPSVDELPSVSELFEEGAPPGTTGRRRTRLFPPARLLFLLLLVTATVFGGGWAVNRMVAPGGSQVSLVVDGTRQEMRTDFKTVGALLAAEHVRLGAGDAVVPPAPTALHDGLHVDVLRAFPVSVDIDGVTRTVRTVEHSAEGLAKQLKLGKLTEARNQPGRLVAGSTVVYRTRVTGSLKIDNQTVTFDSPSRTVDELLQSYRVQLVGEDYVLPPRDTVLTDGATVAVVRVGADVTQDTEVIPFDTVRASRSHDPDRPDPRRPGGPERHPRRHVPPEDRERRQG